ncbi:unnamed protein product [Victoria cruziana]
MPTAGLVATMDGGEGSGQFHPLPNAPHPPGRAQWGPFRDLPSCIRSVEPVPLSSQLTCIYPIRFTSNHSDSIHLDQLGTVSSSVQMPIEPVQPSFRPAKPILSPVYRFEYF